MNYLLVLNPVSGDRDKTELLKKLHNQLRDKHELCLFKTSGENDVEEIKRKIKEEKPDRILVGGGDGTIKLVAEAIEDNQTPIGILPLGSANGFARDLDLPTEIDDCIPIALKGKTRKIDAIKINDEIGLHISDFGLNATLIREYENSMFRGKLGYAINSIVTLFQDKGPYDFTIETEDFSTQKTGIMLAIANSKKFGTGATVNPNGKIDDGVFEILLFKKLDLFEILKTMDEGSELSSDFFECMQAKEATITTEKPVNFQIDGEFRKELKKVEAKILPQKLTVATHLDE